MESWPEQEATVSSGMLVSEDAQAGNAIWFESRALTGGSRNQIDLSKTAKLIRGDAENTSYQTSTDDTIKGGLLFFGVDPDSTSDHAIRINFEGIDYDSNTILYPSGEKANGTWRLHINGVDSEGNHITTTMSNSHGPEYLTHKVLVFNKIEQDYFSLTVFPESDLSGFIETSELVAKNGAGVGNAKHFGLLWD